MAKSVLLIALLVLLAFFISVNADPMPNVCQVDNDCPLSPCSLDATCRQGVCYYTTAEDYTQCVPHDWCYSSGVCMWGECIGEIERDCSEWDGDCAVGICNSELQRCEPDFFLFGTVCDDEVGPCEHPGVCSGAHIECEYPGNFEDGTPCETGLFCMVGETCHYGECVGGYSRDCSEVADDCNTAVCNENEQRCEANPKQQGTACSTGLLYGLCLDSELCDGEGSCVQHFKEEGTVCRQGDGTPCNPDEECTGQSSFCPIDQIDQSPYCRERPINCIGDDCDHHCERPHYDDHDAHEDHDSIKGWLVAILIICCVGFAVIAFVVFVLMPRAPSPSYSAPQGYEPLNSKIGSQFVSLQPRSLPLSKRD